MDNEIKVGDKVRALWVYPEIGDKAMMATVVNLPRGAGDTIQLMSDDGSVHLINPYHWAFAGITKANEPEAN